MIYASVLEKIHSIATPAKKKSEVYLIYIKERGPKNHD